MDNSKQNNSPSITQLEAKERARVEGLRKGKIDRFRVGDNVRVAVRIVEANVERIQHFEGVCIDRRGRDLGSSFTVRKISYGEGVERVFPLYSPRVESVSLIRRGRVRRARLNYLRKLRGKASRIRERTTHLGSDLSDTTSSTSDASDG